MELERKAYFITQENGGKWTLKRRTPKQADSDPEDWETKVFEQSDAAACELIDLVYEHCGEGKILPRDERLWCHLLQIAWDYGGGHRRAEPHPHGSLQGLSNVYNA